MKGPLGGSSRGFVLPAALFLLAALTALSLGAFLLARSLGVVGRMDADLIGTLAASRPPPYLMPAPDEEVLPLGDGFVLLRAGSGNLAPHRHGHRLGWNLDPGSVAGAWAREGSGEPKLGPIPLSRLLAHLEWMGVAGGTGSASEDETGGGEEGWVLGSGHRLQAPDGMLLEGEAGAWLLLAPGGVEVSGEGSAVGVILAGGEVSLSGGTELVGAIRARDGLRIALPAELRLDSAGIHAALDHPVLTMPFLVPGGERLGRF